MLLLYGRKKMEANDSYMTFPFSHSAGPGIRFRSSDLSSNFLHCTDFNLVDKVHEWHQNFHWEREEKK